MTYETKLDDEERYAYFAALRSRCSYVAARLELVTYPAAIGRVVKTLASPASASARLHPLSQLPDEARERRTGCRRRLRDGRD